MFLSMEMLTEVGDEEGVLSLSLVPGTKYAPRHIRCMPGACPAFMLSVLTGLIVRSSSLHFANLITKSKV